MVNKIAVNYVLYGRFVIDLVASLPIEIITLVINTNSDNLKFIGMIKMIRLLRLGRMITFLKANQKLKFSMKIAQLVFFILMFMHWINCLWYFVVASSQSWYPPKDLDSKETNAYTAPQGTVYNIFYYYSALILVGNEMLPSDFLELLVATFLVFFGTIFIGIVIGEFASILAAITKKERIKSEEFDIISVVMLNLRLPEGIQDRVFDYYEKINEANFITNTQIYDLISYNLVDVIKLFQTKGNIYSLGFLNAKNNREIESF